MRIPLFFFASLAFAAQDATITNAFTLTDAAAGGGPTPAQSGHCTAELTVNTWAATPTSGVIFNDNACGMNFQLLGSGANISLQAYWTRGTGGSVSQFTMTAGGFYVIRFQVDPATKTHTLDGWNSSCVNVYSQSQLYTGTSGTNSPGQTLIGNDSTGARMSWFRLSTDTFAAAQNCPTTAATGRTFLSHWKFEGNLNDSSGNNHTFAGGSPAYNPTLTAFATLVVPIAYSTLAASAPPYAGLLAAGVLISNRAGQPQTWDGSQSFSQADASSTVTCFWQSLSGPSVPIFSAQSSCITGILGLTFGDYTWQITATDAAGNLGVGSGHVGAVGTDSNGIVVQSNPNSDVIYNSMIAFGQNPWGLQDYHSQIMVDEQYASQGCCAPPIWATSGQGTISYKFCGVGGCSNGTGTALSSAITSATQTSIQIANVSLLDLGTLPTSIYVDSEVMIICSTTGLLGAQTLTVCPGGRGIQTTLNNSAGNTPSVATTHLIGANVGQFKISGSSTLFTSDPARPICPSLPSGYTVSPVGIPVYSSGTVTMNNSGSSVVMTGSGTSWTNGNGIFGGSSQVVVIWGTTGGTTKFSFVSQIASAGLTDSTHINLNTAWPAGADTGPFNYAILNFLYPSLNYTRADSSVGRTVQGALQVCIGDTQLGGLPGHDYGVTIDNTLMTGMNFSYINGLGQVSAFGPNFYGTGLAARAHYLRSGYGKALALANFIDDYWARSPEVDGGYAVGEPLLWGGGAVGAVADLETNPSNLLATDCPGGNPMCNIRGFGYFSTSLASGGCLSWDTRDTSYQRASNALLAKFDVGSYKSGWVTQLENLYNNHDVGGSACKQSDNSFSNAYLVDASGATPNVANSGYAPLNLTNGSATATDATGLGITSDRCNIVASGTLTVTFCASLGCSGAAVDSGGNFVNPNPGNIGRRIIIHGTKNSGATPYIGVFSYVFTDSQHITLNGGWPGDSGSFTYVIEDTGYPSTIGLASRADSADMQIPWACTWVNSSTITLDRPWTGTTQTCSSWPGCAGTVYNLYQSPGRPSGGYAIGGFGQQPYMLGISVTSNYFASQVGDGTYDANWKTLGQNSASWLWNNAYDPYSQGIHYGELYGGCDHKIPVSTTEGYILGTNEGNGDWCQVDKLLVGGVDTARGVAVEALGSFTQFFQLSPTGGNKTFGDTLYGSIFASNAFTTGGVYTAPDNTPGSNQTPVYLAGYKYPGFYFGMGMSHQWPAIRVGGVAPANPFAISQPCVALYSGTASCSLSITAPNGVVSTVTCAVGTSCSTTIDARQGSVYVIKQWISGGAVVLGTGPGFIINPS